MYSEKEKDSPTFSVIDFYMLKNITNDLVPNRF